MKKVLIAGLMACALSVSAYARDTSECHEPPYGATQRAYNAAIQAATEVRGPEAAKQTADAIQRICIGQSRPGKYRDNLRSVGFSEQEILNEDPAHLYRKLLLLGAEMGEEGKFDYLK